MNNGSETSSPSSRVRVAVLVVLVATFLSLLTAYTKYVYAKDYNFLVEAPCNPDEMSCYVRDCNDYCPPNELEIYQTFLISASDYSSCTSNSCENVCENEATKNRCIPVLCEISDDNDCTS